MEKKKHHKELDDGRMEIDFSDRPAKMDGTEVKKLIMREPTVEDQITAQQATSNTADAEVTIYANLLELSPENVRGLTLRQYKRLQAAYEDFLS